MKKILSVLMVLVLFLAGCGEKNPQIADESSEDITSVFHPRIPDNAEYLEEQISKIAKDNKCTGASVIAFENGEITFSSHYGFANKAKKTAPDNHTQYRIASLSKLVSAVTIMHMADSGKLDLDEDINKYLGYTVRSPYHPNIPITTRMLLSHSSSIFDGSAFNKSSGQYISNKNLLTSKSNFQGYKPGSGYEYSNLSLQAAGAVAEMAAGETFNGYAEKNIFKPMGITAAYLASELEDSSDIAVIYNQNGAVSRSVKAQLGPKRFRDLGDLQGVVQSSLTITPEDYAKIIIMLLNGGEYQGVQILSKESAGEIFKVQYEDNDVSYGLCVRKTSKLIDGKTLYCHSGEAFGILSAFAFDADAKTGAVVVTNGAKVKKDDKTGLFIGCRDILQEVFKNA